MTPEIKRKVHGNTVSYMLRDSEIEVAVGPTSTTRGPYASAEWTKRNLASHIRPHHRAVACTGIWRVQIPKEELVNYATDSQSMRNALVKPSEMGRDVPLASPGKCKNLA